MHKGGWIYTMANHYRGAMYVEVTADLIRRVHQHREGSGSSHIADFHKTRLIYAKRHEGLAQLVMREKLVKKWRRETPVLLAGTPA